MSTATVTTTTETNVLHNHRTANLSEVLGHTVCDASHGLEAVRAMARALADAIPDDPEDKPDAEKVRELSSHVLAVWREVKMLNADGESVAEPFMEQIDLEVMALTLDADDPERLEKTAASAVEAVGKLLSFHGQALLDSLPATTA